MEDTVLNPSDNNAEVTEPVLDKEPRTPTGSPEIRRSPTPGGQTCPVCLGPIDNVSFTDTCAHEFCFACLVQWSRVKPECPLCKRRFQVIMYNVKSAIDYSQLPVTQIEPERTAPDLSSADLRLFRYHSTLAGQSDFLRRTQNREVAAIRRRLQQMIDEMRQRSLEQMRQRLYRNRLKSVVPSNGRIRDASPAFFKRYPASAHRLMPFLNRELRVLFEDDHREVTRMLNLINSLLPRFNIMSPEFIDAVRPFLGSRSRRFCQELLTFAKCPYDLAGYDRNAIYEADYPPVDVDAEPDPPNIAALISSPVFNPDQGVRMPMRSIHEVGPSTSTVDRLPPSASAASYTIEISSESNSDSSDSDNSWVEVTSTHRSDVGQERSPSGEHPRIVSPGSPTDCLIVGYDKPWEQRTPVLLSSDSSDSSDSRIEVRSNSTPSRKERKRQLSSFRDSSSSSNDEDSPSLSTLAARGKRWSPRLLAAAGTSRSSFFPPLLSDVRTDSHQSVSNVANDGSDSDNDGSRKPPRRRSKRLSLQK